MPTTLTALIAYINQYISANGQGKITGPILAAVLIAMATYFATYYQSNLSSLPSCTVGSTVAPVATGQPFMCQGVVVIAQ